MMCPPPGSGKICKMKCLCCRCNNGRTESVACLGAACVAAESRVVFNALCNRNTLLGCCSCPAVLLSAARAGKQSAGGLQPLGPHLRPEVYSAFDSTQP